MPTKAPPKKRNLAAKALRSPLFKPKVDPNPKAYKRVRKIAVPMSDPDSE